LEKHPISISPADVSLPTGGKTLFKVYNKEDRAYYQVWVKFTIETPGVVAKNIGVDPLNPKGELGGNAGPVQILADHIMVVGTDQEGSKAICVLIASLDAKETQSFVISNKSPDGLPIRILASVWDFAAKPGLLIEQGNESALSFSVPESFTVEAIRTKMRRAS